MNLSPIYRNTHLSVVNKYCSGFRKVFTVSALNEMQEDYCLLETFSMIFYTGLLLISSKNN